MKTRILSLLASVLMCMSMFANGNDAISLNGKWNLSYWKQLAKAVRSPEAMKQMEWKQIPATVPGNVELDLLAAGLIQDPMIGNNVNDLRPWEGYQWCYSREFTAPELKDGQQLQLWFGGIDCLADVWVNGKPVGTAENMMIEHAFDVTDVVQPGKSNLVQVIIRSAVIAGQEKLLGPFSISNSPAPEAVYTRKAAHGFGWDILPRLVSAGLWRNVELRILQPVRLRDVHYLVRTTDVKERRAEIYIETQVTMPFDCYGHVNFRYTLSRNGKTVYQASEPVLMPATRRGVQIDNADLWWPRGYGEPALYDAKLEIVDESGKVLAEDNRRIGLRTVKLDLVDINLPDKPGKFNFLVNGEHIFIHGTNWVPVDALHSRDAEKLKSVLDMAVDMNCNMIRCWGGNVYEDHSFYDFCDAAGILVWQDFAMGCTFYPQRPDFAESIREEVTSVVLKLRNHPCIALWSGNNENDESLSWALSAFNINPNHDEISRRVIPSVIYEFDPSRPYLPSSPYMSQAVYDHGNTANLLPERHLWGPRGYYKASFYTDAANTFVSEIGYHGCPNEESLRRMMTPECVYPWKKGHEWNEEWLTKSVRRFAEEGKTFDRNNLMLNQIRLLFGEVPNELSEFIFASQSVQAEAMKYFVERWRGNKPERSGILWWNLRDGWPVISDAVVDYYGSKKMAYYFIRNVQHNVCAMVLDAKKDMHPLVVVNDTRQPSKGEVKVTDLVSGKVLHEGAFSIPANGREQLTAIPERPGQGMFLIEYHIDGQHFANHYLYGQPPYDLDQYRKWLRKTKIYEVK